MAAHGASPFRPLGSLADSRIGRRGGDAVLVEAIDLLLSFESWSRLREDQGLSIAKAKRVLKQAIEALLEGHSGPDTRRMGEEA